MITQEEWMDLLSYRQMAAAGATWAEIARLSGCDWRTARKYLTAERPQPPRYRPRPPREKVIDRYADLVDAALRASVLGSSTHPWRPLSTRFAHLLAAGSSSTPRSRSMRRCSRG